jgi:ATP-dependent 26S proteasome regulatory subunit
LTAVAATILMSWISTLGMHSQYGLLMYGLPLVGRTFCTKCGGPED